MGSVGRGTVVPELQRALGIEARALLDRFSLAETRGKLMQSKAERLRQIALLDQQTAQLKSGLADLNGRLVESKGTLRHQQLRSHVDGVVFDLKPTSSGFTANPPRR